MIKTEKDLPFTEIQKARIKHCVCCGRAIKKGEINHKISSFAMTTVCDDCFKKSKEAEENK